MLAVFYLFLLIVAALGVAGYLAFFFSNVPGAKEERLGALEALPPDLGKWIEGAEPGPDGLLREQRHLFQEATGLGAGKLILQVRYRDPSSREIVRVEPEQLIPRRRVRP